MKCNVKTFKIPNMFREEVRQTWKVWIWKWTTHRNALHLWSTDIPQTSEDKGQPSSMKVPTIIMIEMILRNRDSVKIVSKLMLGDESWAGDPQPYPPPPPPPTRPSSIALPNTEFIVFSFFLRHRPWFYIIVFTVPPDELLLKTSCKASAMDRASL